MEYREAYEKALQLLNVRFLSERELRDKLRRRGAADAVLDEVVVYRYYARKGQYGHLYIANRLRRRGLPVPEDVERPDEYALAQALAGRKFSYRADEARKAARFLQYRGFSPSVIGDILEDFTGGDEEDDG